MGGYYVYMYLHQIDTHWNVLTSAVKIKQFYGLERDCLEIQSIVYTVKCTMNITQKQI